MNEPGRKAEQKETSSGGRRLEDLRGLFVHSSLSEERLFAGMVIFSAWILPICPMFMDGLKPPNQTLKFLGPFITVVHAKEGF